MMNNSKGDMMKIFVEKHYYVEDQPILKIDHVEGGEKVIELIKNGVLALGVSNTMLDDENYDYRPCICFVVTNMVEDGDYDMEDNYIPYNVEEHHYVEIFYCPITGEKIEFVISKEETHYEEMKEYQEKLKMFNKKRTHAARNAVEKLRTQMYKDEISTYIFK
jgi:hypothetical protein